MKNKILLLLLLLSLSIFTGCDKTDSIDNKLKNIGYNNSEITVIKDKLTEDDIQYMHHYMKVLINTVYRLLLVYL